MSLTGMRRGLLTAGALLTMTGWGAAQDARGSISGRVSDSSGGVLPDVEVAVENVATGVVTSLRTNATGLYHAFFLLPGEYKVTVQAQGFRTAVRKGVEVRVEDRVSIDVQLDPAVSNEEIDVVASQPLLETSTATSGQVVDSKTIAEMPLGDGTAYFLARLAPGVEFTGDPKFTRPMDNVNLAGVSASGVSRSRPAGESNDMSSQEFTLDGAPNLVSGNRLGFSPPASSVQEFKVSTTVFDAQFGHGSGGKVSLMLKSGSNRLQGELSYNNRDESRSANTFFANKRGEPKERRDYHRATMMLSGPIQRNKTFFMVSTEYLYDDAPEPYLTSVPTALQREGDFSEYPSVQIYDPFSSQRVPDGRGGTRVVRDPFPGNRIPAERIDPIARKVLSYYPLPNVPRDQWRADLSGNYYTDRNRPYDYRGGVLKLDHVINANNRVFLNTFRNWRMEDRNNWSGTPITQNFDYRSNTGALLGWSSALSASSVLDVRLSVHKFGEWEKAAVSLTAKDFGFGQAMEDLRRGYPYFPFFDMDSYEDIGSQRPEGRYGIDKPYYTYSFIPTYTKILRTHTLRAGYEFRMNREVSIDEGFKAGRFNFDGNFTHQGTGGSGGQPHRDLAELLLGAPSSGSFDTNAGRRNRAVYMGGFAQDDWRIAERVTVNLGLRWEMELGTTEEENRNTRGFDFTSVNPLEAPARARLAADIAANPLAYQDASGRFLVTPQTLTIRGGYTFADARNRNFWRTPALNLLPRTGIAYQLNKKLVVRAGWGLYLTPYTISAIDQRGYSRSTAVANLDANDLPRRGIFEDPVPYGLRPPVGSSLGLLTNVGNSIGARENTVVPYDREHPRHSRFQLGFQQRLPGNVLLEANYVGSRGYNLIVQRPLNFLPREYMIDSLVRDRAREDFLGGDVPNPFRGLEPLLGTGRYNANIDREDLLKAYPQFDTFRVQEYVGSNRYDSAQIRIEKRFSKGFGISANYTLARLYETVTRLNESDAGLIERVSDDERPRSYKIATVVELPFGKGRRWGRDWPKLMQTLLGGWRLSANYLWQQGTPFGWGNRYYDPTRDPNDLKSRYGKDKDGKRYGIDVPAWDRSGFYFHDDLVKSPNPTTGVMEDDFGKQVADDRIKINSSRYVRSFPQTIRGMRGAPYHNLDIGLAKTFEIGRTKLQIRADALNAENFADFSGINTNPESASFGLFNGQRNLPRDIQIGARLTF